MEAMVPIERFEVFAANLDHPECVAFDREGNLWAGGEAGQVYRIGRDGVAKEVANLGSFNGGIAFSPADELIVCNPARGLVKVDRDGRWEVFATHAGERKLICPNFPVYDRAGNLYVSDSGQWKKENGCVWRFTPDGGGEVVGGTIGYANGLALSADEQTLFVVESDRNRVLRMEMDGRRSVYATDTGRLPDGLALDVKGNLYVSCYASDDIHRVSPDGAVRLFAYDPFAILLSRPTNMAFDGEWMYVANLGRTTISRAQVGIVGQTLANCR